MLMKNLQILYFKQLNVPKRLKYGDKNISKAFNNGKGAQKRVHAGGIAGLNLPPV